MGNPIGSSNANVSSNQVKWDGPDIPCIELCNGDTISSVMYKIAEHICTIETGLDLSDLTFECLLDCASNCPKDYSLKAIIQVLLDNDCKLKELIDSLSNQISSGNIPINVPNLKCLVPYLNALFVTETTFTLNDLLQSFVNILCDQETKITDLIDRIQALEVLVLSLQNIAITGSYSEPSFTTCVNSTVELHSVITPLIADYACAIRTDMGSAIDIANSIAQQCLTEYSTNSNIVSNPTNLAQDNLNKWIIICDLLSRIKFMEDNCCAPTCDDIKVAFSSTLDTINSQLILTFSNSAGNFIPLGFTDCGSTITFTDSFNNSVQFPITITNGLTWTSPTLGLDFTNPIDVIINTCFQHQINELKCIDAFSQTIPAQDIECKICKLCASGGASTDELVVTYYTSINSSPLTVTLQNGACLQFEIPTEVPTVTQMYSNNTSSAITLVKSGDCPNSVVLPSVTPPTCWFFPLPFNQTTAEVQVTGGCISGGEVYLAMDSTDYYIYNYTNLLTSFATIPLSGKITEMLDGSNNIIINGTNSDYMNLVPKKPTTNSSIIKCIDTVGSGLYGHPDNGITFNVYDPCVGGNPTATANYNIQMNMAGSPTSTQYGILIKIVGQDPNIQPFIEMKDPVSNALFYSRGTLTNTCSC